MKNLRSKIFEKVDSFELMNHYLRPYHHKEVLLKGQNISNPFLFPSKQKTPSFNIYPTKNNYWKYYDFSTSDSGDIFDLLMKIHNISFKEAQLKIAQDFNIQL